MHLDFFFVLKYETVEVDDVADPNGILLLSLSLNLEFLEVCVPTFLFEEL